MTPTWEGLAEKPAQFPPSEHTHAWNEITDKPGTYPPAPHVHEGGGEGPVLPVLTTEGFRDGNSTEFLQDKRLHLKTEQKWMNYQGHLSDLLRLQWTAPRAKPAISWLDEAGRNKAAIVTHDLANNELAEAHRHISIETTMGPKGAYAGQLFTRLEIPYDTDVSEIQVHNARFTMSGNFMRISNRDGGARELRLARTYTKRLKPSIFPGGYDENGVGIGMPDYDELYSSRWSVRADGATETGANSGSDFHIVRFDDQGAVLDSPLFIRRSNGRVGVRTTSPTTALDVNGSGIRIRQSMTPTSSNDPSGSVGDWVWDEGYVYVKTNAGWKRSALESF